MVLKEEFARYLCKMKTWPFYILFVFFLCLCPAYFAQNNHKLYKTGVLAMREKNYEEAVHHFRKLYNRDSTKISVTYDFAEACRLNMETEQALHLYQKVVNRNTKKYPLGVYWTAQLYKQLMQYKEAGKWFTKFSKMKLKKDLPEYKKKAKQEIEVCELAAIWMNNPLPIKIERLDTSINTRFSEYAPYAFDGTFYFSSLRSSKRPQENEVPLSKIYVLEKNNKRKPKPYALDTTVNASYLHNANAGIDESGKRLVFSRCKNTNASEYTCALYQSDFVNNKWQAAVKLGDSINLKGYASTHPSFALLNKKQVLFYASNRPGGAGGMDIWYAERNADGTYSNPKNAGKYINTNENEITPAFNELENTLYFSSTAHKNFGAYDIFKSAFQNGGVCRCKKCGLSH
jgi:hypothetical protein